MSNIVERADLYFREGSSDKVYSATLEEENGNWRVCFAYGRRGAALTIGIKEANLTEDKARKTFNKLVASKTGKGYQYTNGSGSTTTNTAISSFQNVADAPLTPKAQLLNPIEEEEALALIADDGYFAQPKHDGVRFMLGREHGVLYALNRRGKRVPVPIEIENVANTWEDGDFFVDGELIGTTLHIFDILQWEDNDYTNIGLDSRILRLALFSDFYTGENSNDFVKHSPTATNFKSKGEMYNNLLATKQEGIVFKRKDAPYKTGRPNSGGANLKFKFYETCSCIVTEVNNKRSVGLGLYDGGKIVSAGNVTISINFDIPKVGDIVEVRYLYARKASGALSQPVLLSVRNDIIASECKVSQLKYKSGDDDDDDNDVKTIKEVVIKDKTPVRLMDLD